MSVLSPASWQDIHLVVEPTDMRLGVDRLGGIVRGLGESIYSGDLFVFVSRRQMHLKILTHTTRGIIQVYKRLDKGRFIVPGRARGEEIIELSPAELHQMLG